MSSAKIRFHCERCPAYCCSYPVIRLTKADLRRLAKHLGLSLERTVEKYTKPEEGKKKQRIMRHRKDEHYGSVCRFLDLPDLRALPLEGPRPRGDDLQSLGDLTLRDTTGRS
jgi:Fe-S-cluster containining protein